MYFRLMGKLSARRKNLLEENEKGFTLIELLVVVLIIGVLAAIAIPVYLGVQSSAQDNAVKSQITNAKTAVVAAITQGTDLTTIGADTNLASLTGYTPSTEIPVAIKVSGDAFCISGADGSHVAAIDDRGAAVKDASCDATGKIVAGTP